MGLFDKKRNEEISFPEPPAPKIEPAFPEPPANSPDLDMLKEQVEKPAMESPKNSEDNDELEIMAEPPMTSQRSGMIPEPVMPTTINPVLYIKLSEYKEVVEATNSMRKDIEKIKTIVTDLRKIEKEEHSRLEKSEELIKDINKIVNLFEKTMVTPTE